MAYKTYITEAIVCGSRHQNTYDKAFLLFTREAGMVWANARSVRKEASKQRYALQEFSHIRASLVSGKGGWRIAGVESLGNFYSLAEDREARTFIRNIIRLLRRTIQGESAQQELYDSIVDSFTRCNTLDQKKLELILSLRILHELGYISPEKPYSHLLSGTYTTAMLEELSDQQLKNCGIAVEQALLNSQL
jgi:DNA repair protein RecO